MSARIVIYTTQWCRDCEAAKRFLGERGIAYEEVDIEQRPEAAELVMRLNDGMRKVPTIDIEGTIVSGDKFDDARFEKDLHAAGVL
jgi:mycoredoxin